MLSDSSLVMSDDAVVLRRAAWSDEAKADDQVWHDDTQVRAAQLTQALDAARGATSLLVLVAAGLFASFWSSSIWPYTAALFVTVTLAAVLVRVGRHRKASPRGVQIRLRLFIASAASMGAIWGFMPVVLFAGADADHRLVVIVAIVVAMGAVYRLSAVQRASLLYLVPICLGSFVGLVLSGSPVALGLAAILPLYGWFLLSHCARVSADTTGWIVDRIVIAEQNHAIEELLLDFDENISDWLWRTDAMGRFVNVAAGVATAFPVDEGAKFDTVFGHLGASSSTNGARIVHAAFATRKPFRNQLVEITCKPRSHWWRVSGKPVYDEAGHFAGYRGVGSDITGARNSETHIARLENFDALTGFANRVNFRSFAERQCAAAANDGHCRALLSLDLDHFKTVNDRLGHEGGDELLRQVAGRLATVVPVGTFIARLGSDEFALWLQPTTPLKAEAVALALVEVLGVPFDVHGVQANIGASVGIALTPKHALDPDDLLVKADLALYRAKAGTDGKVCTFVPAFETLLIERRKLEGDMKLALARGEFVMHYQPLLDVAQGRVVGFEALIRWTSPDRGFVSPADFIPAAEAAGLIAPIGRWVLFEACRAAASWPHDIHVAVNISPPHVKSPEFLQDVVMALKMSGLHPSRLEIEMTEGVFLDKSFAALDVLQTLRMKGIRIALDDFGTGYSSLNYLIDFPVDKIKIDRSFVTNFVDSHANQAIVDAMLGLARKLSIRVTAEGVETKEQALALKRRRCDELQGYLLSRPRPAADVPDMIESVPRLFREAVPTYMDSPLAMVLTAKKSVVG